MSDAPLPSPDTAKPPIVWRSHGERVFVRVVCGACGARTQVIDVGPRFELGAEPNHGGVDIARRRIESGAFGLTLVKHHLDHASAVSALAAEAVIERMGLYSAHAAAREIGPFAVLLCETQTLVSALPHDVRRGGIELLFHARDPNPLAQATSSLRETWAEGQHLEAASCAMQWWSWRPVTGGA